LRSRGAGCRRWRRRDVRRGHDRRRRSAHRREWPDRRSDQVAALSIGSRRDPRRGKVASNDKVLINLMDVDIDLDPLRSEIKKTCSCVSEDPERDFIFPTGRDWAQDLGYPGELAAVPETAVESFAGVANPWTMGRLAPGERVLDIGSGAGTD